MRTSGQACVRAGRPWRPRHRALPIRRPASARRSDQDAWRGLIRRGMERDCSWDKSAEEYEQIMEWACIDLPFTCAAPPCRFDILRVFRSLNLDEFRISTNAGLVSSASSCCISSSACLVIGHRSVADPSPRAMDWLDTVTRCCANRPAY